MAKIAVIAVVFAFVVLVYGVEGSEPGKTSLRYFPKGPIKEGYIVLPSAMLKDAKVLRRWVKVGIEYALSLPRSVKKGK